MGRATEGAPTRPTLTCFSPLFGDPIAMPEAEEDWRGALAMRKVAVYIAFVLSTAWLLYGSWQPPQTISGNHASHEATNDYRQDALRETETKVARAEGEQLSEEE